MLSTPHLRILASISEYQIYDTGAEIKLNDGGILLRGSIKLKSSEGHEEEG